MSVEVLGAEHIRVLSLDEMVTNEAKGRVLLTCPTGLTDNSPYIAALNNALAAGQIIHPINIDDIYSSKTPTPLRGRHFTKRLERCLPDYSGKDEFIKVMLQVGRTVSAIRQLRSERPVSAFWMQSGPYLEQYEWHRDGSALITLVGSPTCWRHDNVTDSFNQFARLELSIWRGVEHTSPSVRELPQNSHKERLLALFR